MPVVESHVVREHAGQPDTSDTEDNRKHGANQVGGKCPDADLRHDTLRCHEWIWKNCELMTRWTLLRQQLRTNA